MIDGERVAVITGATGSLGSVVARRLAEEGVRLALFSTGADRLQSLVSDLDLPPERVLVGALDLSTADGAREAARLVLDKFHRVDVLLHLVGGWTGGKSIAETSATEVSNMLNQHLWTTFHLAQVFVPHLLQNAWGRVIVVSSPLASNPPANMSPYVLAKAAQEALVLTLAKEVARSGVTANVLLVRAIDAKNERDEAPSAKNANWTTPDEIIAAVLYLCSDNARVVNGARIPLYG